MPEFIKNLDAQYTDEYGITLSWSLPNEYKCLRIVFLHRLGNEDPCKLDESAIRSASDICFIDEFRNKGNRYIYKLNPSTDTGLLAFQVFCCDSMGKNIEFDKSSNRVEINGIILKVTYKVSVKKSGKHYQKVTINVTPEAPIKAGTLSYSVGTVGASYPIDIDLPANPTNIGPIVTAAGSGVLLCLSEDHEGEYEVYQN